MSGSGTTSKTDSTTFPGKVALTHALGSFRDALLGQKSQPAPTILQRKLSTGDFESDYSPIKNSKTTLHREKIQSPSKYPASLLSSTYSPKTDTSFPVAQNMSVEELLDSTVLRPKHVSSQLTLSPSQYHGDVLTPSTLYKMDKEERQRRTVDTKPASDRKMPTVGVSISDFNRVKDELDKEKKINVEKEREIQRLKSDLEDAKKELRENITRLKAEMKIIREECEAEIKSVRGKCEADMKALTDRFEAERKSWREQSESEKKLLEERLRAENKSLREQSEADKKLYEEKSMAEIKSIRDQLEESKRQIVTLTSQLEQRDRTIPEMKDVKNSTTTSGDIRDVKIVDRKDVPQTENATKILRSDVQPPLNAKERAASAPTLPTPILIPMTRSQESSMIEISIPAPKLQYFTSAPMISQYISYPAPVFPSQDIKIPTANGISMNTPASVGVYNPLHTDIHTELYNPNHDVKIYPQGIKYTLKYGGDYQKMSLEQIEEAFAYFLYGEGSRYLANTSTTLEMTGQQLIDGYEQDYPRSMALARAAYSTHLYGTNATVYHARLYLPSGKRCVDTHDKIFGSLSTFCSMVGLYLHVRYSSLMITHA